MAHAPPVVTLALAIAAGAGWGITGAPLWLAPFVGGMCAVGPRIAFGRPTTPGSLTWAVVLVAAAVSIAGLARGLEARPGCRAPVDGATTALHGRFLAASRGGSASFVSDALCAPVTVVTDASVRAGVPVIVSGRWMPGRRRHWLRASGIDLGEPAADRVGRSPRLSDARWLFVRWRAAVTERFERLYGSRAPMVSALTLARREGMDRTLSDGFARAGISHLLAISGFHVGLIAAMAFGLLRAAGVPGRRSRLGAVGVVWLYVLFIGMPDAAARAALILALASLSRSRGRPPARWGALASAMVLLLATDPSRIASPGFQLSFLGAAGLIAWADSLTRWVRRRSGPRCPRDLAAAIGAGIAATVATLPAVAWHFERVSLVGVPVTLLATPLVSLALPGAILSALVEPIWPALAHFLAGGVGVLLVALERLVRFVASWNGASVWVSRPSVVAATLGLAWAGYIARRPGIGGGARRGLILLYVLGAVTSWPWLLGLVGRGRLEAIFIDVGQGDAIALRSPRGRWALVDAGPPHDGDPEAHPVVRALRALGVRRLEVLVLTHPDLDHIGGAQAVLRSFDVGAVLDPALASGKADYVDLLRSAGAAGLAWHPARAGRVIDFDGAVIEVLHPDSALAQDVESNAASVVARVVLGDFGLLLTGDADKSAERAVLASLGQIDVLKLGHHGSDTSTDSLLLAVARPSAAVVSVGRLNRYGHPHPDVLSRLETAGVPLHRTDRDGTVRVVGSRNGSFRLTTERSPASGRRGRER